MPIPTRLIRLRRFATTHSFWRPAEYNCRTMPNLANHLRLIPRGLDPVAANCGSDGFVFSFGAYIEAAGILLGPDFNHRNSALDHRSPDLGLAAIRGTAVGAALGALIATGFSSHWFVYGAGIPLCGIIS